MEKEYIEKIEQALQKASLQRLKCIYSFLTGLGLV